jgi:hypothetical protein
MTAADSLQPQGRLAEVSEWGSRALAGTFGFEHWLRRYIIARIPGATDDTDGGGEPVFDDAVVDRQDMPPTEGSHLVSDLLDREVLGSDGAPVGRVTGLQCEAVERTGLDVVGRLRITGVAYGKRPAGSMLGYRADPDQGPGSSPPSSASGTATTGTCRSTRWMPSTGHPGRSASDPTPTPDTRTPMPDPTDGPPTLLLLL